MAWNDPARWEEGRFDLGSAQTNDYTGENAADQAMNPAGGIFLQEALGLEGDWIIVGIQLHGGENNWGLYVRAIDCAATGITNYNDAKARHDAGERIPVRYLCPPEGTDPLEFLSRAFKRTDIRLVMDNWRDFRFDEGEPEQVPYLELAKEY